MSGRRLRTPWGTAVLALAGLLLAACVPRLAPPGPSPGPPALAPAALITADGLELPLHRWLPDGKPRAVVLGLHGFNDYGRGFAPPAEWLAARGIAVYAYDQRGFGAAPDAGLWPGTGALVADLQAAGRLLRWRHPGVPLYLLGESMGGAVILAAAGRGRLPRSAGAILSASAVWARSTMPFYQRWALWTASHLVPWMKLTGEGLDIRPTDNEEVLRQLSRDPLVIKATRIDAIKGLTDLMDEALAAAPALRGPSLVLYGEHDEVVPWEPTLELWRRLAASAGPETLGLYPQGWHLLLRDTQAEVVLRDIAAWIGDPRAPLPSGLDARARQALATGELPETVEARLPQASTAAAQRLHEPDDEPDRDHHDGAQQHVGHRPLHGRDHEVEGVADDRAEAPQQRRRTHVDDGQHEPHDERGERQLDDEDDGAAQGHRLELRQRACRPPIAPPYGADQRPRAAAGVRGDSVYRRAGLQYGPPAPICERMRARSSVG